MKAESREPRAKSRTLPHSRRSTEVHAALSATDHTRKGNLGCKRRSNARHPLALGSRLSALGSSGFTLTELMVVMLILTLLTVMTVYAVNFSLAAERSRAAARQVQSYLAGARDRAIYERRPVGVRFLVDPNVADTLSSMVYIEETVPPTGTVTVTDTSGDWTAVRDPGSGPPTWTSLQAKGLLAPGVKIRIPDDNTGFWYTVQTVDVSNANNETVTFEPTYKEGAGTYTKTFRLKLPPVVRPNQEPMLLPRGIVVDVERSRLPLVWATAGDQLDVMFSPRGTVSGQAAAGGLIHFYLAETVDVERLASWSSTGDIPADVAVGSPAELPGDRVIVTLFPQTGAISSHPVNVTDQLDPNDVDGDGDVNEPDDVADDPFFFAETGEVAGE